VNKREDREGMEKERKYILVTTVVVALIRVRGR